MRNKKKYQLACTQIEIAIMQVKIERFIYWSFLSFNLGHIKSMAISEAIVIIYGLPNNNLKTQLGDASDSANKVSSHDSGYLRKDMGTRQNNRNKDITENRTRECWSQFVILWTNFRMACQPG